MRNRSFLFKSHEIVYTELATQQIVFCPAHIRDKKPMQITV